MVSVMFTMLLAAATKKIFFDIKKIIPDGSKTWLFKGRQESWVGHCFKIGTLKCQKYDILVGSIVNLSLPKMHSVAKLFFEVV